MIEELIRPHLRNFQAYRSARSEAHPGKTFLDANELSSGSPVSFEGLDLNRYPDPNQETLRSALAKRLGVSRDSVFVGVGSDEIIDLLIRLVCEPSKDSVAILEPTYGVYPVACDVNNVQTVSVSLDEHFQVDAKRTLECLSASTRIIFCCSPNNPTGNLLRRNDIMTLCTSFDGLVVLDEAYVEFAGSPSLSSDISTNRNLVVLRTLSKAWGLAGIRCGYCIADPFLISYLRRIKAPYNMNAVTAHIAVKALENKSFLRQSLTAVIGERIRMRDELTTDGCATRVYPSDANFLLVEFKDPDIVFQSLYRRGIIVRRRTEHRLKNCLRITIGTPEENNLVLETLKNGS